MPLQESGGIAADVHGDIKDFAAQATHEFCFSMGRMLKVHAAHGAAVSRECVVDLHDMFAVDERLQFIRAKQPFQIAPLIPQGLALQHHQARKWCDLNLEPGGLATWLIRIHESVAG